MKATTKRFYIKQRENPQLGTYFVPQGQLSKAEARSMEKSLYGFNIMLPFDSEDDYNAELARLRAAGENVH